MDDEGISVHRIEVNGDSVELNGDNIEVHDGDIEVEGEAMYLEEFFHTEVPDVKKLIELIKTKPELYDISRRDHHNRLTLVKSWNSIGRQLNVPGSTCKDKWHSLRTSYARYLRDSSRYLLRGKRRKKWHLAEEMSFLAPFLMLTDNSRPINSSSFVREDDLAAEKISDANEQESDEGNEVHESSSSAITSIRNEDTRQKRRAKKRGAEVVAGHRPAYVIPSPAKKPVEDHPVMMFFKSLMPDIQKLSQSSQRKFKCDILNALNHYFDNEEAAGATSGAVVNVHSATQH